jgi:hypothetical protein
VPEKQTLIVRLPPSLVREATARTQSTDAYRDLSELVETALRNQLALEGDSLDEAAAVRAAPAPSPPDDYLRLPGESPADIGLPADVQDGALSPFTNRLFPLKIATRVLANSESDVELTEFQYRAAEVAQVVGRRLRAEDERAGRRGLDRRWVALPVGSKASTLDRFVNHFSILADRAGRVGGPLAELGLASLHGFNEVGQPVLTMRGWEFARAENPVLDGGGEGPTLGPAERDQLVSAIAADDAEVAAIGEFFSAVTESDGGVFGVHQRLQDAHDEWSWDQVVAQRAAMVGRLHDLGLATVEGKGPVARISVPSDLMRRLEEASP